jgi:hypothetical protein
MQMENSFTLLLRTRSDAPMPRRTDGPIQPITKIIYAGNTLVL